MSRRSAIILSLVIAVVFFVIGVLLDNVPYFQCETKIRPFEALNFIMILLFGYWFQNSERKSTLKSNSLQKLLEQIYEELATDINIVITLIEDLPDGSKVEDPIKKKIQLKFKSIATNVKFIIDATPLTKNELDSKFIEFKDSFIENLLLQEFIVTSEFLKNISAKSMNLKNAVRHKVYEIQ